MKAIQIFKAGRHTDSAGVTREFTEADLVATAKAYDPGLHEAPIVVGHPRTDDPAYGWVQSLSFAAATLEATPHQLDPAFEDMVRAGRFKKVSASFYLPDSPSNPKPGVYYPRHVGFLGAAAPAVKGLRATSFAAVEEGVIEFDDFALAQTGLWRRMRDFFLEKFSLADADQVLPEYVVSDIERAGRRSDVANPAFNQRAARAAEPPPEPTQTEELSMTQAEIDKLRADNEKLTAAAAKYAERDKEFIKQQAAAAHTEHVAFCDGLVKEGKMLPVQKDATVAILDASAATPVVVNYGEGDKRQSKPALAAIKELLQAQPKIVEFKEVARNGNDVAAAEFATPPGFTVDAERLETHQKAIAYQAANKTDYLTAVRAVG